MVIFTASYGFFFSWACMLGLRIGIVYNSSYGETSTVVSLKTSVDDGPLTSIASVIMNSTAIDLLKIGCLVRVVD